MNTVLRLDDFKDMFKDEAAFNRFAASLAERVEGHDGLILIHGNDVIGSVLSTASTTERVRDKVVSRLFKDPAEVDRLTKRLESDDLVS